MPNTIKLVGEDKMIEFDGRGVEFLMPKGGGKLETKKEKWEYVIEAAQGAAADQHAAPNGLGRREESV